MIDGHSGKVIEGIGTVNRKALLFPSQPGENCLFRRNESRIVLVDIQSIGPYRESGKDFRDFT